MMYKGMLCINGVWIPTPASFDFSVEDLESYANRTADGLMHRTRIGKKIKLQCSWPFILGTREYYSFFDLLDNLPMFFPVIFPHPNGNNRYTMEAYRGNPLSASMRSYYDTATGKISIWKDTKVNFIER